MKKKKPRKRPITKVKVTVSIDKELYAWAKKRNDNFSSVVNDLLRLVSLSCSRTEQ